MSKINSSEIVSLGHPDKIADFISCAILDEYLKNDKNVKYALEVMVKDNNVILGGEITSKNAFSNAEVEMIVKKAIFEIGYNKTYRDYWGKENAICCDDVNVTSFISQQSKDISKGVISDGWGDQGIFWGMATPNSSTLYFPNDWWCAKKLKDELLKLDFAGKDVKTLVTTKDDEVTKVIAAVPLKEKYEEVKNYISLLTNCDDVILNGTGTYIKHSSIADCGITGRKLAVDFYGGNCKIGGGSPWTKDGTKADLSLNIYARYLAKKYAITHGIVVYCSIACCIGQKNILIAYYDEHNNLIDSYEEEKSPTEIIEMLNLNTPIFKTLCKEGLFTYV